MTSLPLFGWAESRPVAAPKASEQGRQAARVGRGIDEVVIATARVFVGCEFHMEAFTDIVRRHRACSPDSPRRRLHALVNAGFIQARCIDRSRSLWRIDGVSSAGVRDGGGET